MYRSHHYPSFSLQYCIMLENRIPLMYVPKNFTTYFINSKRRFFLYLKYQEQFEQLVKILKKENVKFYQRKSIFPDRQENEEIVYHCNYKYIKKDLRWALKPETKLRQPKFNFRENKNLPKLVQDSKIDIKSIQVTNKNPEILNVELQRNSKDNLTEFNPKPELKITQNIFPQQTTAPQYVADFGQIKIRNQQVLDIINNLEIMKALFKSERRR